MAGHDFDGTETSGWVRPSGPQRRGGIGLGVVLIAVGVVFLVAQFVPGVAWWELWPLIVVLVGGIQIVTPDPEDGWGLSRITDGIGTLLVGFVLLGNTTGFVSWRVWWVLVLLWPVLLVAIGLRIIGRATNQSWLRALAPVAIWAAMAYAVATSLTGAGGLAPVPQFLQPAGTAFDASERLGDVTRATLAFDGGAGDMVFSDTGDALIRASGRSPFGAPRLAVTRNGTDADVRLGLADRKAASSWWPGLAAGSVDVGLSDRVLWNVILQTGASNVNADFSRVKVGALAINTGASSVDVKLGAVPESITRDDVTVKAGASSVDVSVPRDAAVRVVSKSGLSSTNVKGDFERLADGSWQTRGFGSASRFYVVNVESGAGAVSVEQN